MPDSSLSISAYSLLINSPKFCGHRWIAYASMNPAVILISDDEDERNTISEEADIVLISSDEDDDYERNLNHQDGVVLISDDEPDIQMADKAVGFDNCVDKVDYLHQGSKVLPELSLDECKLYLRKYGVRLSGTKEECMQRIIEHVRLVNGEGVSLYPRSSFSINCTGDACKGDVVMFKQNIHNSQRKIVQRTVVGRIVGDCYVESKQQHKFSIEVLWSEPIQYLNPLSILVLKGLKLYKFGTFRQPWTSESERSEVLREKHVRGNAARRPKRKLRQRKSASSNNKGEKRQKVSPRGPFQSKQPTQIDKYNSKRKGADTIEENTSTHESKAVTVQFQKTKLKRLKDGKVNSLYPRSSFSINCTGDACKGDVVLFKQKQSIKRGERVGKILTVAGRIVKESYGALRQQHTFTVEVLWTKHSMNPHPVSTILVGGCNLYRFGTFRQRWKNEAERLEVLEEKHKRGEAARHQRKLRLAQIASINEKGGKRQKPSRSKHATRIVKLKLSKRCGATIAKRHKRKSTQPTLHPNSDSSLSKQPTRIDKQKFSRCSTLVKESTKATHKREASWFQRTEFIRSTQPTFHLDLNPNPNRSMYSDHNRQEASLSFHNDLNQNPNHPNRMYADYNQQASLSFHNDPNLNSNHPNRMYSEHNLQEASWSLHYDPNRNPNHPNRMYSDHYLQDASLSFPYDPSLTRWSPGYDQYKNRQWEPNNVFYQPPGHHHYSHGQPGYYHHNFEPPVPRYGFDRPF